MSNDILSNLNSGTVNLLNSCFIYTTEDGCISIESYNRFYEEKFQELIIRLKNIKVDYEIIALTGTDKFTQIFQKYLKEINLIISKFNAPKHVKDIFIFDTDLLYEKLSISWFIERQLGELTKPVGGDVLVTCGDKNEQFVIKNGSIIENKENIDTISNLENIYKLKTNHPKNVAKKILRNNMISNRNSIIDMDTMNTLLSNMNEEVFKDDFDKYFKNNFNNYLISLRYKPKNFPKTKFLWKLVLLFFTSLVLVGIYGLSSLIDKNI